MGMKPRRIRARVGAVFAVPLNDGRYAYGKKFTNAIGIYDVVSDDISSLDVVIQTPFSFFGLVTECAIQDGTWRIIGYDPFENEDDAWGPPTVWGAFFQRDDAPLDWPAHIEHKGKRRSVTLGEVHDFEKLAVYGWERFLYVIVDRMILGHHADYLVGNRADGSVQAAKRRREYSEKYPAPATPPRMPADILVHNLGSDWLYELSEAPKISVVKRTLEAVANAKEGAYIEVDEGAEAVAAALVVLQLSIGSPTPLNWVTVERLGKTAMSRTLGPLACLAVKRVGGGQSELRELHAEQGDEWQKKMEQLKKTLC